MLVILDAIAGFIWYICSTNLAVWTRGGMEVHHLPSRNLRWPEILEKLRLERKSWDELRLESCG